MTAHSIAFADFGYTV